MGQYPSFKGIETHPGPLMNCERPGCFLFLQTLYTLEKKVLHDAIDEPFLAERFHKEPLTSEDPFSFKMTF